MARLADPGPGYREVADALSLRIERNGFPRANLPSVEEISHQYLCPEATVRAALDELRERGIISTE